MFGLEVEWISLPVGHSKFDLGLNVMDRGNELRTIEFARIAGGKAFDTTLPWFTALLAEIGQA